MYLLSKKKHNVFLKSTAMQNLKKVRILNYFLEIDISKKKLLTKNGYSDVFSEGSGVQMGVQITRTNLPAKPNAL